MYGTLPYSLHLWNLEEQIQEVVEKATKNGSNFHGDGSLPL